MRESAWLSPRASARYYTSNLKLGDVVTQLGANLRLTSAYWLGGLDRRQPLLRLDTACRAVEFGC